MKNYLNSLLPYRWIIILTFILLTEGIITQLPNNLFIPATIINIIHWIIIDITFGLGRISIILFIIGSNPTLFITK